MKPDPNPTPLLEPDGVLIGNGWVQPGWIRKSMHAHAAAVSAERDARIKVLEDALRGAERELQSCQSVIHLCGGFDPAYVRDAQTALKIARAALGDKT